MLNTPNLQIPYPEPADNTQTWNYWQQLAERLDAVCPKFACGIATVSLNNAASGSVTVSLPAGLYTTLPIGLATWAGGSLYFACLSGLSATQIIPTIRHYKDGLATGNQTVYWATIALKGTPGLKAAAPEPMPRTWTDADGTAYTLRECVCRTGGCGNADVPIALHVRDDDPTAVQCGVCGQPITDVT